MMRYASLIAVVLLAQSLAASAAEPAKNDPQAQGWYVAPFFTFVAADNQRGSGNGKGGTLAFGHHGDVASVEVAALFSAMMHDEAQLAGGQIALVLGPLADQEFLSRFYGVFALGAVQENNIRGKNYKSGSGLIGDLGLGYRHPLPIQERLVNLRIEARYRADYQMPPRDEGEAAYFADTVFSIGLQIPFSSMPPPSPPPPPPQVVPPVQPGDSTARPSESTAQPAAESSTPAPSESGASEPPTTPP